ncbi:MAG TPA: SPASM domain-containing protein, partial [Patescibacteria group bacterium]
KTLGLTNLAVTRASNPIPNSWFANHVINKQEFLDMQTLLGRLSFEYGYTLESLEAVSLCAYGPEIDRAIRGCSAGRSASAIGFDGSVRACIRLEKPYGHISNGLSEAWKSMGEARTNEWLPAQCDPCKLKNRCGGGCRADALVSSGKMNGLDNFCEPTTELPQIRIVSIPTTEARIFKINKQISMRPEEFGGIIFRNSATWLPVNKDLLEIFYDSSEISIEYLVERLSISEAEAIKTASVLSHKGFLIPN